MLNEENEDRKKLGLVDGSANGSSHADTEKGEVQTVNIWKGGEKPGHIEHEGHTHDHQTENQNPHSHTNGIESTKADRLTRERLEGILEKIPSEEVWRIKGFLQLSSAEKGESDSANSNYFILNWAFGRHELHPASERMSAQLKDQNVEVRLTVMGARGDVKRRSKKLAESLGAEVL
jgi:G3E family GTPase